MTGRDQRGTADCQALPQVRASYPGRRAALQDHPAGVAAAVGSVPPHRRVLYALRLLEAEPAGLE